MITKKCFPLNHSYYILSYTKLKMNIKSATNLVAALYRAALVLFQYAEQHLINTSSLFKTTTTCGHTFFPCLALYDHAFSALLLLLFFLVVQTDVLTGPSIQHEQPILDFVIIVFSIINVYIYLFLFFLHTTQLWAHIFLTKAISVCLLL